MKKKYDSLEEIKNIYGGKIQCEKMVASVNFLEGTMTDKDYDFYTNIKLNPGDTVVVETVHGLRLAKVNGLKMSSSYANKWVVDVVDLNEHKNRIYSEERKKALKESMELRAKKLEEIEQFKALAETDPEMKHLLEQYQREEKTVFLLGEDES